MDGTKRHTVRQRSEETVRANQVLEACPALAPCEIDRWRWQTDDPEDSLEILAHELVRWPRLAAAADYEAELMAALKRRVNRKRHVNVLQHIMGYLKRSIDAGDKQELGASIEAYRRGHMAHHKEEFGPNEPDIAYYRGYPIPASSWRRKMVRDASGNSGWKNLKGLLHAQSKQYCHHPENLLDHFIACLAEKFTPSEDTVAPSGSG